MPKKKKTRLGEDVLQVRGENNGVEGGPIRLVKTGRTGNTSGPKWKWKNEGRVRKWARRGGCGNMKKVA